MSSIVSNFKEMLLEQAEYKELLYQVTLRDLRLRYKQTIMGFGWAVFMPLLNTALFSVIFVRVAPIDTGVAYPVWVYCGLAVWNFFSAGVKFATNSSRQQHEPRDQGLLSARNPSGVRRLRLGG